MDHSDLVSAPVNLRVVFHKPHVAEDDGCSADISDMEGGSVQVTLVLDYEVHDLSNVTSFIGGSVYIIDGNSLGEALGA